MTETHVDLAFYSGSSWSIDAALHDAVGDPLDLTGAQVAWRLYDGGRSLRLELGIGNGITVVGSPVDGKCRISVTASQSAALAEGSYRDEIVATASDGYVCTQAVGFIKVLKPGSMAAVDDPCATLARLQSARLSLLTGQVQTRVRIENFEVQYSAASMADLDRAIANYESLCRRQTGRPSRRFAIGTGMRRTF